MLGRALNRGATGGFIGGHLVRELLSQGAREAIELRLFGRSKMKIARTIGGHLDLLASLAWSRLTRRSTEVPLPSGQKQIATEIKTSGLNS